MCVNSPRIHVYVHLCIYMNLFSLCEVTKYTIMAVWNNCLCIWWFHRFTSIVVKIIYYNKKRRCTWFISNAKKVWMFMWKNHIIVKWAAFFNVSLYVMFDAQFCIANINILPLFEKNYITLIFSNPCCKILA